MLPIVGMHRSNLFKPKNLRVIHFKKTNDNRKLQTHLYHRLKSNQLASSKTRMILNNTLLEHVHKVKKNA